MIIYVDWSEHELDFFDDEKLDEALESLKSEKTTGSREIMLMNKSFELTPLAYNVDGEFGRHT